MTQFTHLHVHSHYSMLDGMSKIPDLIAKCRRDGMTSMALTDHGNMFGIKDFLDTVAKVNSKRAEGEPVFKPIVGTEAYCARRTLYDKDKNIKEINPENGHERVLDSSGYHLILLAKNLQGYHSLCKLASIAYTDGFYNRPRIDHNVLKQYHEGLICSSACVGGEIPQLIMAGRLEEAEQAVVWFKEVFGDDYYIELMRHRTDKPNANYDTYRLQMQIEPELIRLARKHNIKLIATNDAHFVLEEHGEAHDHLICLATKKDYDDPTRMHYTKQEWLKSPEEMAEVFADLPEALENTMEVAEKVEVFSIDSDPIMPVFPIPESFGTEEQWRQRFSEEDLFNEFTRNENGEVVLSQEKAEAKIKRLGGYNKLYRIKFEADYLEHLVWEGARKRYLGGEWRVESGEWRVESGEWGVESGEWRDTDIKEALGEEVRERIVFELHTIKTMGFPGYFLIVSDYIRAAREELGVSVGPGRGSAAGSVVAYCLWITDIDPLKYDLLFERFLNPDRISLPDIDVDFDDAGRGKVLEWVTQKYGKERVAHIITYGTMATKSSIADVGRVEKIPLGKVNELKGYIPDRAFPDNVKDDKGNPPKVNLKNCYRYVPELHSIIEHGPDELRNMLVYAEELEDTNRQIGIHACGVIIGADDLTNVAPVCVINDKDTGEDVLVTQYDGHVVENVGLIKMDFLGLKNLTIIRNTLAHVKKRHGVDIDIDHIPIDDERTYRLYCEGNTVGTFQFESPGMQKYLRELKPHVFEDLIAMNALYRPGPMDNIPDFIDRKLGRKPIKYDIPCMEQYLKDTYGITVYQEQVMLLSRQLAGFTRGQSDTLRKAMGKKQIDKMNELEVLFYEGGERNGHPREVLKKIWEEWKKFASYAFNKSHATCYSWVAYQTAYLKAHYPAEYMAAVMTSAQNDIKRVSELMEDCLRNGVEVLAPSVNESERDFSVNKAGQIRFGLQAVSGMGVAAADAIIEEREKGGLYVDVFDFLKRVNIRSINRNNVEVLVKAGAFDDIGDITRAQFFYKENSQETTPNYIEYLMRWASRWHEMQESSQLSIFDMSEEMKGDDYPPVPVCEPWTSIERCRHEKEVIGMYLSGHPLDDFKYEMRTFATTKVAALSTPERLIGQPINFGGIVTSVKQGVSQSKGDPYGIMVIEDYSGSYELRMFGDTYSKFKGYFTADTFVFCQGSITSVRYTDKQTGAERMTPPRLKIQSMKNLGGILAEFCKALRIYVRLDDINDSFVNHITSLSKKYKGNASMEMRVVADKEISLLMRSSKMKVDMRAIMPELDKLPEIIKLEPIMRN